MSEKKTITYNLQNWHFIVFIVIANIICAGAIIATSTDSDEEVPFPHPILVIQLIVVGILIGLQIMHGFSTFKKCKNCGHRKHQHDKAKLIKKGFHSICPIICDNYERAEKGEYIKQNFQSKYKDGYTI